MARRNRVSVYDGIYHVTARIAHRALLLGEDDIKDKIMEWTIAIAEFSGVELWAFAIMDNHIHLFVHVPPVPEEYWLNPAREPSAYAFGMRPLERREPLWSGQGACPRPFAPDLRPETGFMLDDEAMLSRLGFLYGKKRASAIAVAWSALREQGLGKAVDSAKDRYCRRMYNLSQYIKTLKERVSMWYNATYGHAGSLWEGRFYSGVVEKDAVVKAVVAAYIGYNPVKAKLVNTPERWRWSSYAQAVSADMKFGAYCRKMYERLAGCPWEEFRGTLESMFADRLPASLDAATLRAWYDDYDSDAENNEHPGGIYRASQAIRVTMKLFSGAYIGRDREFFRRISSFLPRRFPHAGDRSLRRCRAFAWILPDRLAA